MNWCAGSNWVASFSYSVHQHSYLAGGLGHLKPSIILHQRELARNQLIEVAVMARYLDQLVSCQFTLVQDMDGFKWPNPPANNYVDELVYEKLRQLQFEPAAVCSDNEFVRRVYVDVIGALPTIAEQDAFFANQQPDRRQRLIDSLLERPEHARFWALKWGDLLRLRKSRLKETGVYKFYAWLVDVFEKNMPFDRFAVELLTAQGSTYEHPAANYYRACDDSIIAAETTTQLFLGSRIRCEVS